MSKEYPELLPIAPDVWPDPREPHWPNLPLDKGYFLGHPPECHPDEDWRELIEDQSNDRS